MSSALEMALFLILIALLAAASAIVGWLWMRVRALERRDVARRSTGQGGGTAIRDASAVANRSPRPASDLRLDPAMPNAIGPTLIAVPDLATMTRPSAEAALELVRRFGPIWDLADSGASAEAIARVTEQPIGQVELILGLRRSRGGETTS